jgi:flagellar biosynthesis protein FlhB
VGDDSDLERTEEPTARRLDQARSEGQIARSQELPTAAVLVSAMGLFLFFGPWFFTETAKLFAQGFRIDYRALEAPRLMPKIFADFAIESLILVIPVFIVCAVVGFSASIVTGGFNFAPKAMAPKFSKMNPLNGIQRIFGINSLVELFKAVLKFSVVATALYLVISLKLDEFLMLSMMPLEPAMAKSAELIGFCAIVVAASLIIIALIDVPWQKHSFHERMKMTKQQVKDEMKDVEGRPEVKSQIRKRQREMAANRMMQKVKDADVVVTNPEHFSVALAYDPASDGAPVVLAMGVDELAFRIREEAKIHGVTIFPAPPLARALYYTSEVDQPIHHDLYFAVAQVIAYVFNLNSTNPDGSLPTKPDPSVPESMQFDALGRKAATQ